MNKFNIGDKVIAKDSSHFGREIGVIVGIDPREDAPNKYLVKFDSLDMYEGWMYGYRFFINNPELNIEPYEGRAVWLEEEDLVKVKEECEEEKCEEGEVYMNEFNIGDKVISKDNCYPSKEVGTLVGIDTREEYFGLYLVKFDSLDKHNGWRYGEFYDPDFIIEPYEGYAVWLDDITKVEDKHEEDKHEEDIRMEFDKIREQKKEVIKSISEKVLEMTLEIKEMEHEIEKIKKEWHL